ncbi:MAG: DUF4372 domain-containing protein, partial [Bacteroidetes bacterium]|nr:DUF4372 domain-containing protein [Bacteroidota bacterium]
HMDKTTLFTGQPVFNQLLSLIPKRILKEVIKKHQSDRYYKRFKTYDHVVTMLFTTFHGCKSLREVTTGMMACTTRLNHLGIIHTPLPWLVAHQTLISIHFLFRLVCHQPGRQESKSILFRFDLKIDLIHLRIRFDFL